MSATEASTMTLTVLFFAQARDRAGCARRTLELPDGSRVGDAVAALRAEHPALEPLWPHLKIAMNGALVAEQASLVTGSELALLPPVSGG